MINRLKVLQAFSKALSVLLNGNNANPSFEAVLHSGLNFIL